MADAINFREQGVAAGHQQRDKREFRRLGFQHRRQQVSLHVVHLDRRDAQRPGQAAADRSTGHQRPDQSRAGRVGNRINRIESQACTRKRLFHKR
jgi:hypothetical protein